MSDESMAAGYPTVEGIHSSSDDGVLRLTLDRPDRRNAVTDDMVTGLTALVEHASVDEEVRVVLLAGSGDHFSSGFDLSLRGTPDTPPRTGSTQRQMRGLVNRLIPTLLESQTPIVAAGRGWCAGLGLSLLLAADFAVVADDARLWAPFTRSAFSPDSGLTWLLPRLAGVARAKEMLMLDREISGTRAADWGLVHRAVPAGEVAAVADGLAGELANSATVAVGLTKLLIQRGLSTDLGSHLADEALALEVSSRSADFKAASRARREGGDPHFDGR